MKITNIETFIVWGGANDSALRKNFQEKNFCFVVVDTDEGIYGVGESGLSSRELAVQGAVEHFKQFLIGRDPFQIERLWQEMFRGAFFPAGNILTSALAAIDIALWDIKGKALGVPVYELLGGLARDRVLCWSMSVFPGTVFEPREAVPLVLAQFEGLRKELGSKLDLIHDVHARLDPPEAIELCRAAEQLTDYARVDVCIAGGITETRKIANWAEGYYIRLATHNPLGPVSSAACLQVNLATANVGIQEQPVRPDTLIPDVVTTHIEFEDGYLLPTTVPGIGVEFNREAARKNPYRPNETTHLTRRDGSFTNW